MTSFRQRQIDEVLQYHDNISRIVTDREKKHVYISGLEKSEPKRQDLVVEAEINQKVQSLIYDIQNITQNIHYLPSEAYIKAAYKGYTGNEYDPEVAPPAWNQVIDEKNLARQKSGKESFDNIFNFLTKVIRDWNNLIDFYSMRSRQQNYTQNEEVAFFSNTKQLIEPLKTCLSKVVLLKSQTQDYFKIFNTIKKLTDIIEADSLEKIPFDIMSDSVDIKDYTGSQTEELSRLAGDKSADYAMRIHDLDLLPYSTKIEKESIDKLKKWYSGEIIKLEKFSSPTGHATTEQDEISEEAAKEIAFKFRERDQNTKVYLDNILKKIPEGPLRKSLQKELDEYQEEWELEQDDEENDYNFKKKYLQRLGVNKNFAREIVEEENAGEEAKSKGRWGSRHYGRDVVGREVFGRDAFEEENAASEEAMSRFGPPGTMSRFGPPRATLREPDEDSVASPDPESLEYPTSDEEELTIPRPPAYYSTPEVSEEESSEEESSEESDSDYDFRPKQPRKVLDWIRETKEDFKKISLMKDRKYTERLERQINTKYSLGTITKKTRDTLMKELRKKRGYGKSGGARGSLKTIVGTAPLKLSSADQEGLWFLEN